MVGLRTATSQTHEPRAQEQHHALPRVAGGRGGDRKRDENGQGLPTGLTPIAWVARPLHIVENWRS